MKQTTKVKTRALPAAAGATRTLDAAATRRLLGPLRRANSKFMTLYPGDSPARQPVHTVYGGAHLFRADTAPRLGVAGLQALHTHAPSARVLAEALRLGVPEGQSPDVFVDTIYRRVLEKLEREPVEDFRIDFEDGYGNRSDEEEDHHATQAAQEVARGMKEGSLPPFIGIRIKPLTNELAERSLRTLDIFVYTVLRDSGGALPGNFVTTLPKVTVPEQVATLAKALEAIESKTGLAKDTLRLEIMIEQTQAILDHEGRSPLPGLVAAARGRCTSAHLGTYDYTASCNITAAHQTMVHPACDFAKHMMQVAYSATGITLSDGATNVMPVGPHRATAGGAPLSEKQLAENRAVVHRAWKMHYDHIRHSLTNAYYQGWDLHPAQLPTRYAAVYAFFLEGLEPASIRLKNFMEKAAQATLVGDVFDDAATGQGLLNFFLRGVGCGAITLEEAQATGLTLAELQSRSFVKILAGRRQQ